MPATTEPRISDYALIGDCHGTALVGRDGSIDWACLLRFDSAPTFGRLLDPEGGAFRFHFVGLRSIRRRYLPETNVLETEFMTTTGTARGTDAFAMRPNGHREPYHQLMRFLSCVAGKVEVEVQIEPRFDYGSLHPWLTRGSRAGFFRAVGGDQAFVLWTDATMDIEGPAFRCRLDLKQGEQRRFSITAVAPELMDHQPLDAAELDRRLAATIAWWRDWTARGKYPERYREAILRSALLLKLLTCAPTGAIVAAPTTSLPEWIGGTRNWDYRFAWVRDASMTMEALHSVGHEEVARGLWRFLERSSAGSAGELQIMYGCHGERRLHEVELPELAGFRGSRPVRVGNLAHQQLQLDVYGEIVAAAWLDQNDSGIDADGWRFLSSLVEEAIRRWREPDQGIWESRGPPQHYVHSKAMCWYAVERGLALAETLGFPADTARWQTERDAIRASIEKEGVDQARGCFVHAYGSSEVDASLLRLALIGFVPADDPLFVATVEAIQKDLLTGSLLRRHLPAKIPDGVDGEEGAFLLCAFWLVDVWAMQGRMLEAEKLFEELLAHANDVGLLPEEIDPKSGEFLGNFPQAFSHMAMILAAQQLQQERPASHRGLPVYKRRRVGPR